MGFMLTTSIAAKGPTATNSGSNASTASTVPPRRSLFAASTTGSKPFLNDTIGARGAKDDNPFIEHPVRKLFKPNLGFSKVHQGPGGGPTTSIFGRSRLLQKSVTGKSLSASTSISGSGTGSTSTKKDGQMGARKNNKQRLVLTRVYPINSSVRFSGPSSLNNTFSEPTAVALEAQRIVFNSGMTNVPTPTSNSPEEVINSGQLYSSPLYHRSTTPKAPPPNREFYQSLSKITAPRFLEKTHDDSREKDTSMETDNILEPSDTLAQEPSQGSIMPPSNVMVFARKSIMKHVASSPHSIFRKFNNNKPSADTPPIELVHSPQEASLGTEVPAKQHSTSSRMEVEDHPIIAVKSPVPRTIQPSDGFFVFQSHPRPDIPVTPTTETKTKPARSRPAIERPVLSRSVLDFSNQPDPKKKDTPSPAPISTAHDRSKRVDISSEFVFNSRPTLDPIPPRELQLTPETSTSLETDNPAAAQKFDIRAALRMVRHRDHKTILIYLVAE